MADAKAPAARTQHRSNPCHTFHAMADRWPQQDVRPDLSRSESGSDAGSDAHPRASDDPIQSPLVSASSGSRAKGLQELPAVREVLLGTINRPLPDLQALYQASGTSVDELLEQKKAIDCLASASLINAGVQRQKKGEADAGKKRSRSKAEEAQGGQEGGTEPNDSESEKPSKTTTTWTEDVSQVFASLQGALLDCAAFALDCDCSKSSAHS